MTSRRRAFTLVELLVVVGIATMLIAVLFPALTGARRQAQRVHCAANLRSIGQALTLYTQQYGYYPGSALYGTRNGAFVVWQTRLRALMGGEKRVFNCPAQDPRCEWTDGAPGPVERATAVHVAYGYDPGERVLTGGMYFSYGVNAWGTGVPTPIGTRGLGDGKSPVPDDVPELRASRVKVPAEMIAVADATADGRFDHLIHPYGDVSAKHLWPGAVHSGGPNVLFCDGHVQWYAQKDLLYDPAGVGTERYNPVRMMWNYDHTNGRQ